MVSLLDFIKFALPGVFAAGGAWFVLRAKVAALEEKVAFYNPMETDVIRKEIEANKIEIDALCEQRKECFRKFEVLFEKMDRTNTTLNAVVTSNKVLATKLEDFIKYAKNGCVAGGKKDDG
jgi:hypothetical protein